MKKLVCILLAMLFAMSSVYAAGVEITSQQIRGSDAVLHIASDEDLQATVFCASYDENGMMLTIQKAQALISAGGTGSVSLSGLGDYADYKIFVLDENGVPQTECSTLNDGVIHLRGDSIDTTFAPEGVSVDGSVLTITEPGTYSIEGTLTDGQIILPSSLKKEKVTLNLLGVDVSCSYSAPFHAEGGKISLIMEEDSVNVFRDNAQGEAYSEDATGAAPKGCFYSKRDLTIEGNGLLKVEGSVKNGIACGADLSIKDGANVTVNSEDNSLKGNDSVSIGKKAGTITAVSENGDAMKTDAIDDDGYIEPDKGTVSIKGGNIVLKAPNGDGIQADQSVTVSGGSLEITSGKEGIKANEVDLPTIVDDEPVVDEELNPVCISGSVEISGGTTVINAGEDGVKGAAGVTVSGGSLTVTSVNDGIQSDDTLTISGGTVDITTSRGHEYAPADNDEESYKGVKAGNVLTISGGTLNVDASDDAVHSNYIANITGGDITVLSGDDGVHADYLLTLGTEGGADTDFTLHVDHSYEGMEASVIRIYSGTSYVVSSDDGINGAGDYNEDGTLLTTGGGQGGVPGTPPGGGQGGGQGGEPGMPPGGGPGGGGESHYGLIEIHGGRTLVLSEGDGLDSNGSTVMTGGLMIVNGPQYSENDPIDFERTFTLTGGTLIGMGVPMTRNVSINTGSQPQASLTNRVSSSSAIRFTAGGETYVVVPGGIWTFAFVSMEGLTGSLTVLSSVPEGEEVFGSTQNGSFYGLIKLS